MNIHTKRTKEEVLEIARQYKSYPKFREKHQGYVTRAKKEGWFDEILSILPYAVKMWNDESVKLEALKFTNGSDFSKYAPGAYNYATKKGIYKEVTKHFNVRWEKKYDSKEKCAAIAAQYKSKIDFLKGCDGAYSYAVRHGFLDEICAHMERAYYGLWTEEQVREEALKYTTRKEFQENACGAWNYAHKHGILDEVCAHMRVIGNHTNRCVYAAEFTDHYVYVGLTHDSLERWENHMSEKKYNNSAVRKHMDETGLTPQFKIIIDYEDYDQASKDEGVILDKYKQEGWFILNRVKTGALGGCNKIWTKEKCIEVSFKCESYNEFRIKYKGAVASSYKCGWIDEIKSLHPEWKLPKRWNNEEVIELSSHYDSMSEFRRACSGGYTYACNHKLLGKIREHNGWQKIKKEYSKEEILNLAHNHVSIKRLQHNHPRAYNISKEKRLLDEVKKNIKPTVRQTTCKWTDENVIELAGKFKYKYELKKAYGGAYDYARRHGLLDNLFYKGNKSKEVKWTEESIMAIAKNYTDRSKFKFENQSAYVSARNLGCLQRVLAHMPINKTKHYKYTDEYLAELASKYTSRQQFKNYHPSEYVCAKNRGILQDILSHLPSRTGKRCKKK